MITHVVLFKPGPSASGVNRRVILERLREAIRASPGVRRCSVGRRVRHGLPGYERVMAEDYGYALLLEFDDLEGLKEYLTGGAHQALGELFTGAAAASLAYDYQMVTLEEAHELL